MKPAVTLFVVISTLVVMWANAAAEITAPKAAVCPVPLTEDMYKRIHSGMTCDEICDVVEAEPTERVFITGKLNKEEFAEIVTWTDASCRSITVCFRDGAFHHKDQAWILQ